MHRDATLVLEKLGGDASGFQARQLTAKIALDADLVLTMTKAHRDAVLELAPLQLRKTFTLTEASLLASQCNARNPVELGMQRAQLAGQDVPDIQDPIGQSAEVFAAIGAQIADLLPPILKLCRSD